MDSKIPLKLFGVAAVVKNPWSGRGFVDDLKGIGRPFPTNRFYWTDIIDYFVNYSNKEKTKLDVYGKEYNLKNDEGKIHFVEDTKEYLKNCSPKKRDEFLQEFKESGIN